MPSPLVVPVAPISKIRPHSNAENLEIAEVLGWQCVVQKDRYCEGEKIVYIAPDSVLEKDLSDAWGITQYLHKGRIKPTRLRGEPSFGLVMSCDILPCDVSANVGDNVAEHLPGISKWEPPTREQQRGQGKFIPNPFAVPRNPLFTEYTHIANLRHYPDLIGSDELVVVTEKLHGTNSRIGIIDGEWVAGSHRVQRGEADALYWSPKSQPGVETLIMELAKRHRQVILYGEILGSDVQSLSYGYEGYSGYRAFDLMIDGRFVDFPTFRWLCTVYGVSIVPVIGAGLIFDFEFVRAASTGPTVLGTVEHIKEGVVVKPIVERTDPRIGRCVLKYVSDDYLLAKHSDFAEV
jgi:RNA ligase (TIGR02306 family)